MSSAAYLDARAVVGPPETDREAKLVDALERALSELGDPQLHRECKEKLQDAADELRHADEERLRDAPEPEVPLHRARAILRQRREREPVVPPSGQGYDAAVKYDRFAADRDATDLIEQLLEEVTVYRKLAKVEL